MTATVIAGGAHSLLTVRHIRLSGSQHEIGRALAAAAHEAHGDTVVPKRIDRDVERVRRRWFERNYPTLHERTMGTAAYFGIDSKDTSVALDTLGTHPPSAACSVGFYPGPGTSDGHATLARNMDFATTTLSEFVGRQPLPGERAAVADPWVVETYPDHGYASLTICFGDAMGAMDGINDAGLAVALLADSVEPSLDTERKRQVGLTELQLIGYVLDNCATAEEAKDALRLAKHYYLGLPCHYVVADRTGASFVWEHSLHRNREIVVTPALERNGHLVCTNHLLQRWPDATGLSDGDSPAATATGTFRRWRTLTESMDRDSRVDRRQVREHLEGVRFVGPAPGTRTIWHAIYDLEDATAEVGFYLGDRDGTSHYSPLLAFSIRDSSMAIVNAGTA
jgi:predicted choloylglycine hydrolase